MNKNLASFLNDMALDDQLQRTMRGISSAKDLVEMGSVRGYKFTEPDLINYFAATLTRPNDDLASFLKQLSEDEELQNKLRPINTAEGIVAIASQSGYHFIAADLIRHFAEVLVHADDPQVVIMFDALGWQFGSLLWALKLAA